MDALATGHTMSLIAQLPQDQAEAVILRVVVGLDAKSAAETLGKRPGAVRTAAHRGLKRLAELLGAADQSGVPLTAVPPQPGPRAAGGARPLDRAPRCDAFCACGRRRTCDGRRAVWVARPAGGGATAAG